MSIPANMATQAATKSTTWALCCKFKLVDGEIIALTEHDKALSIDLGDGDGAQTYTPADAVEMSDERTATDLAADNIEVIGAIEDARIRKEDLHRGRYEGAELVMFAVDWQAPASGQDIKFNGVVGIVKTEGIGFNLEIRSTSAFMGRVISSTIGEACPKSFGSTALTERHPITPCGVNLNPSAWQGNTAYTATLAGDRLVGDRVKPSTFTGYWFACTTAGTSDASSPPIEPTWPTTIGATVADGSVVWTAELALAWPGTITALGADGLSFTASGITVPGQSSPPDDILFARGRVEWLTGNNAGIGRDSAVATDDGAGGIRLYKPTIRPMQVGDTFTIYAGCDRSQRACISYSNWVNLTGHIYVPPVTI